MKKTIVVMLLTAILTACLIGGLGAVSAETQLYVAVSDLDVYVSRNGSYVKAFQIPKTYYFTSSGAAEGGYMRITYGSAEGDDLYVRSSDVAASAQTSDDDLSADPNNGAYIADGLTIPTDGITQLKVIFLGNNQFQDLNFTSFSVNRIYGIYTGTGENGDISGTYIYVDFTYTYGSNTIPESALIAVAATNRPTLTINTVTPHPNSVIEDDPSDPVIDNPDGDATVPDDNNVTRNIMIALICVLCVIVIFLIFRPTKNKKDRYELSDDDRTER